MRSGFTLIEICVATVIIGVAVTALMTGIASGTRVNDAGQNLTEAIFLTQEVRECTLKLPYSSVAGLGGTTYSPPIDGRGQTIGQLSGWSQAVAVAYMNPASPTTVSGGPSDVILVTVTISRNNAQVMSTSWLVARKIGE
jgi:prepilin-type N-terminal cleavage/methylation domain-containing protein